MYRTPELKITIQAGMTIEDIHRLLANAFELPDYYGLNWDAFSDCINDDAASNPPERLIVFGWDVFVKEHPRDAKLFISCLNDRDVTDKATEVLFSPRACPCCEFLTLKSWRSGSWEVCPICEWEDDDVQFNDADYHGGANNMSLNQARKRYQYSPVSHRSVKSICSVHITKTQQEN